MVCFLGRELLISKEQVIYIFNLDYIVDYKNKLAAEISYGS